jgi:methyl-accepting chemotaxis protein
MKAVSIKAKAILVLVFGLTIGAVIQIALVRDSYNKNVAMVATSALNAAQRTFENIKAKELASLELASSALVTLDSVRELFLKRDRDAMLSYLAPMFADLKAKGINVVTFMDKDANVVFRLHAPQAFGDSLRDVTTVKACMATQNVGAGIDLVKPGLTRGSCRAYRDKTGAIIGYVVAAGPLDQFVSTMKTQTSDDYLLMANKSFLDEKLYHSSQKAKGLPDTWDQFKSILVLAKTAEPYANYAYERDLENLSADGKLLGTMAVDDSTYVRGVFPLYDPAGKSIGGIFFKHDISALHQGMKKVQNLGIAAVVALTMLLSIAIGMVLNKLVFVRLKKTMETVTRVVGGEFTQKIVPTAADEVGHLEELIEQFRTIFVGVVDDLSKESARNEKNSA